MANESDAQRRADILRGTRPAPPRAPAPVAESAADVSRQLAAGVSAIDARLGPDLAQQLGQGAIQVSQGRSSWLVVHA